MEESQHIPSLKSALGVAADQARTWFEASSSSVTKASFVGRSARGESLKCGVYVYYCPEGVALYVGQSKRRIKLRLHDQTSPHAQKPWWGSWSEIRFLAVGGQTDRLVLELLLILAYAPAHNRKPAGVRVAELFSP